MSSSLQIPLTTAAHHDAGSVQEASGASHHVVGVRCTKGQNVGGNNKREVNDAGPRGVLDRNLFFGTPFNGPRTVTFHFVASFSRDVRVPFPHFGFVDLLFKICVRHRKQNRGMPQITGTVTRTMFLLVLRSGEPRKRSHGSVPPTFVTRSATKLQRSTSRNARLLPGSRQATANQT